MSRKVNGAKATAKRQKWTTYTDRDPDVQEMILRAKHDSRNFSSMSVAALRPYLILLGYGDKEWKGPKFSDVKCN